ncbi:MAG: sigma-70 family RNA polymerase sigma factor [Candidatus Poribacteria bacterium]|nr:sigma-70 family RNA polymerase sigma factor [Candidatus Poribacteria bacterium]
MQTRQGFQFHANFVPMDDSKFVPETELEDAQLVERFHEGDSEAFNLLYLRYRSRIHGVVRAIITNPEDALDVTQDVFLKAYQGLGNFKKASQFYSWLYRITINRCIDYMRHRSKHRVISDDPVSDDVFYGNVANRHPSAPSKAVENEEFYAYLRRAVMQLSPKQREVFILRYREDLPLKEIGRKMGRSTGTIKAHLFQAQRNLRVLLLPYLREDKG